MITIDKALDLLREHSADNLGEGESEENVAKAEAKLGIRFPDSYRHFLRKVGYAEVYGDEIAKAIGSEKRILWSILAELLSERGNEKL